MNGKLHSLTDVLKKTLFFFETMTVAEMAPHVQKIILRDFNGVQAEDKVSRCLKQNRCFEENGSGQWSLNLEGERDNDSFYAILLKRQQPMSIKEVYRGGSKNKRKFKSMVSEVAGLISDGRFIQLSNGYWGLTEWEVETGRYSLKQLVIKALKTHPGGLSANQAYELVNSWKPTTIKAIEGVLEKFPYFEKVGDGVWSYNSAGQIAYDALTKRFLVSLTRQRERWVKERDKRNGKQAAIERQLREIESAYRETAAALALKMEESGRQEQLVTQMAEKDLLLSLRKKEIFRYREHIMKLEAKSNSILYQCRLWVKKARDGEEDNRKLREALRKNQTSLETLFTKLQQYKEKDRENKARLVELKDRHATRVAELQTEIVELKNKLDRTLEIAVHEERGLKEEINSLSNDLKEALETRDEAQRNLRFAQQELNRHKEEKKNIESRVNNPLVRMAMRIYSWFGGYKNYTAS
ncbi:hypothetical protein DCCM_4112 [Desulfocucumis palustris]|uniref:Phage-shock protein n=1 Tax=Desulfocucumis palustris TaxID=1898651 RepID=A0A2L2XM15_9FIRM|nr:phage-shock protein [Desulfocucumis palustris]GBF34991.1 hypothetical protein DCCM_4112 [Desulfocucumis palustris]